MGAAVVALVANERRDLVGGVGQADPLLRAARAEPGQIRDHTSQGAEVLNLLGPHPAGHHRPVQEDHHLPALRTSPSHVHANSTTYTLAPATRAVLANAGDMARRTAHPHRRSVGALRSGRSRALSLETGTSDGSSPLASCQVRVLAVWPLSGRRLRLPRPRDMWSATGTVARNVGLFGPVGGPARVQAMLVS
jgi:hypothetical protein